MVKNVNRPQDMLDDEGFRSALEARSGRLWHCIDELQPIPLPPPGDSGPPQGTYDPDEDERVNYKRDECLAFLDDNWGLLTQFADPSARDAQDLIGNLYNTQYERLHPYIPVVEGDLNPSKIVHYDEPLPENQGGGLRAQIYGEMIAWTGETVAVMRWRIGDLLTALSWQIEVMESLRAAMEMYRALLAAARAKVLDICDNTIKVLEENDAEADSEILAFLQDAGSRIGSGVSKLDFSSYIGEVAVAGPKAGVLGLAKDVAGTALTGVVEAAVAEISEPDSSDPMPPLRSMVDSIRNLRALTQGDSDRIKRMVDTLSDYVGSGGGNYKYLLHEDGDVDPPYPYGTGTGINDGASYTPEGIRYIAEGILPPVAEAWESNRRTMDGVPGANAFRENLPAGVDAEHMFLRLKQSWFRVRGELTEVMTKTVSGIRETSRLLKAAADQLESNELANTERLTRLERDVESTPSTISQTLEGGTK